MWPLEPGVGFGHLRASGASRKVLRLHLLWGSSDPGQDQLKTDRYCSIEVLPSL